MLMKNENHRQIACDFFGENYLQFFVVAEVDLQFVLPHFFVFISLPASTFALLCLFDALCMFLDIFEFFPNIVLPPILSRHLALQL